MQDEPTPTELIKAVADFLRNEIAPPIKGHNAFKLRVGINALDLVTRQLTLEQSERCRGSRAAEAAARHATARCSNSTARSRTRSPKARSICRRRGWPSICGRPRWTSSRSISRTMRRTSGSWGVSEDSSSRHCGRAHPTKQSSLPRRQAWMASLAPGMTARDVYFPTHFGGRFSENAFGPSI